LREHLEGGFGAEIPHAIRVAHSIHPRCFVASPPRASGRDRRHRSLNPDRGGGSLPPALIFPSFDQAAELPPAQTQRSSRGGGHSRPRAGSERGRTAGEEAAPPRRAAAWVRTRSLEEHLEPPPAPPGQIDAAAETRAQTDAL